MLNVQTVSTTAGASVEVNLNCKAERVLVKNFGEADIWVADVDTATKTSGMVRIPGGAAQLITVNDKSVWPNMTMDKVYVYADEASQDSVEIQAIGW